MFDCFGVFLTKKYSAGIIFGGFFGHLVANFKKKKLSSLYTQKLTTSQSNVT